MVVIICQLPPLPEHPTSNTSKECRVKQEDVYTMV